MLASLAAAETQPTATGAIAPGLNLSIVDIRDRLAGGRVLAGPATLLTPNAPQPLTEALLDQLAARVSDGQVKEVLARVAAGEDKTAIAKAMGVSRATIYNIIARSTKAS